MDNSEQFEKTLINIRTLEIVTSWQASWTELKCDLKQEYLLQKSTGFKTNIVFNFYQKIFSQEKYVSWGFFNQMEQNHRFSWFCLFWSVDISLPILYSLMNSMNVTTPQPQGQTEKILNYEVSVLGIFSLHEKKI